jgi:hypothetical protein
MSRVIFTVMMIGMILVLLAWALKGVVAPYG